MTQRGRKLDYGELSARYQGVFDAAVDGIAIIDETGILEAFNAAAEQIFGYRADEVIGRNVSMLMPEPDASRHDSYLRNYIAGGPARIIGIGREVVGRRRNGELFPMDLAVGEVRAQQPRRFVGMVRDITARRAVENALAGRERELRLIFDSAPIGIFTATLDGRITAVNSALCALVDTAEAALLGSDCADLAVAGDRVTFAAAVEDMRSGVTDACDCELRWTAADGSERNVSLHGVVVRRADAPDTIIGQVVDHTDQVRSELESREVRERLAHVGRVSTLGEMASAIAHEINQPLTAITAYAQASRRLLDSDADLTTITQTLDAIAAQALRAGDVVKRIRGFVSHRDGARSRADLNEIVDSVFGLAALDARSNGVQILTGFGEALPEVLVDMVQIQQVILNLIRNAIDAMASLPEPQRQLRIDTSRTPGGVAARFADNGPGIDPEIRDKLFQPFQTTKPDGMGMGLSISSSIIAAHGGRLALESGEHAGAVFTLTLPETEA